MGTTREGVTDMTSQDLPADRRVIVLERFEKRTRATIRPLLTKKVIAEHKRNPIGDHSDNLKRVLNYFRRSTTLTPYVLICTRPFREWRIARLSGERDTGPAFVDEETSAPKPRRCTPYSRSASKK
jgi:branched-chain amino acid transport system permease protein